MHVFFVLFSFQFHEVFTMLGLKIFSNSLSMYAL